jgi:hypothetical protein
MPKFELDTFMDYSATPNKEKQELKVVPEEGDLRLDTYGNIEVYRGNYWQYVGDLQNLFNDISIMKGQIDLMESKQKHMEDRIAELVRNRELEDKFPDLAAAGEYCEEIRVMLKRANDGYAKMVEKTLEKLHIFEELQKEPEENNDATV